ncbi:hypothetical protein M5689_018897 [Euphorbia peplus]|nr:hypothetical protein M5689_018897 [Euphorbia peplus]
MGQLERNEPPTLRETYGPCNPGKERDYQVPQPERGKGNLYSSMGRLDRKRVRELPTKNQYREYSQEDMRATPRTEEIPPRNGSMTRYQNFELFKNLSQVVRSIGEEIINQNSVISREEVNAAQGHKPQLITKVRRAQLSKWQKLPLGEKGMPSDIDLKRDFDLLHREGKIHPLRPPVVLKTTDNMKRFCDYHQVFSHPTTECDALRKRVEDMTKNEENPGDASVEENPSIEQLETSPPQIMMIGSGLTEEEVLKHIDGKIKIPKLIGIIPSTPTKTNPEEEIDEFGRHVNSLDAESTEKQAKTTMNLVAETDQAQALKGEGTMEESWEPITWSERERLAWERDATAWRRSPPTDRNNPLPILRRCIEDLVEHLEKLKIEEESWRMKRERARKTHSGSS